MKIIKNKKRMTAQLLMPERAVREEAAELPSQVRELVTDGYTSLIFDFTKTSAIDSATLGALIHARREYPAKTHTLSIQGASGYVKSVLDNARISTLFNVYPAPGGDA